VQESSSSFSFLHLHLAISFVGYLNLYGVLLTQKILGEANTVADPDQKNQRKLDYLMAQSEMFAHFLGAQVCPRTLRCSCQLFGLLFLDCSLRNVLWIFAAAEYREEETEGERLACPEYGGEGGGRRPHENRNIQPEVPIAKYMESQLEDVDTPV
jgi:hypothetical protein